MSITINGATNTISSTGTVTMPTIGGITSTGNSALGDAEASDTHAIKGATTLLANSASAALTVTQTGAGNAFVVEDSTSPDSTPFVITDAGAVLSGHTTNINDIFGSSQLQIRSLTGNAGSLSTYSATSSGGILYLNKSRGAAAGTNTIVQSGDTVANIIFAGADGTNFVSAAQITASIDGTPGTNDMPGCLVFSTTADGASSPTERMRIDSAGNVGIGGAATAQQKLRIAGTYPGVTGYSFPVDLEGVIDPSVASTAVYMVYSHPTVSAGTLPDLRHFSASPGAFTGTVTTQYGFIATSALTGATNNYGFYSNIASAANRYNFYAAGTADNVFMGAVGIGGAPYAGVNLLLNKSITGSATVSDQCVSAATILSDVTSRAGGFSTYLSTQAASFTLANLRHYSASQNTVGAGSTITNQFGFFADSFLTGATNNYGVYSNIASAANRYNFYAAGTAANYFAGVTGIGVAAASTSNLTVAASTTAVSSLNIPHGAAPTSPVNGDMWTTTAGLFISINGVTKTVTLT